MTPKTTLTDNRTLEGWIRSIDPGFDGAAGRWRFHSDGVEIVVLTDETHDRMRAMALVADASSLSPAMYKTLLEANFDRALDARYALWQGTFFSVYLHPLSPLTRREWDGAVHQVAALKRNFGTTYTSSDLVFGSGN